MSVLDKQIYDEIIKGLAIKKVAAKFAVKEQYVNYVLLSQCKEIKTSSTSKLEKIKIIEDNLFHLIETDPTNKSIDSLAHVYSTTCV